MFIFKLKTSLYKHIHHFNSADSTDFDPKVWAAGRWFSWPSPKRNRKSSRKCTELVWQPWALQRSMWRRMVAAWLVVVWGKGVTVWLSGMKMVTCPEHKRLKFWRNPDERIGSFQRSKDRYCSANERKHEVGSVFIFFLARYGCLLLFQKLGI